MQPAALLRSAAVLWTVGLLVPCVPTADASQARDAGARVESRFGRIGQPAPPIAVDRWLIEPQVRDFEGPPIRVVHFWTPGSSSCLRTLSALSALQEEFGPRGVEVLGLSGPDGRTELEASRTWVDLHRSRLRLGLGWIADAGQRERWLGSGSEPELDLTFVVDRAGRVVYRGRAMWLRAPLEGLLAGTWDLDRDLALLDRAAEDYAAVYRASGEHPGRVVALVAAFRDRYPQVAEVVGELEFEALLALDRGREAASVGRRIVARAEARRDAAALDRVSWALVDPRRRLSHRDLELALRAATEAARLTEEGDAYVLDTLARVHAWRGDLVRSLELQRRAVELQDDPQLRETLAEYSQRLRSGR